MRKQKSFFKSLLFLGVFTTFIHAIVPNAAGPYIGISKLTDSSIQLSAKDNSDNEDRFHILVYDYATSALFKSLSVPASNKAQVYVAVTGLTCDKTYKAIVVAENADGNSTQSDARYFNLKSTFGANCVTAIAMPGPYIGVSAIEGSSTSVRLSFKDNSNNEGGFTVFGSGIYVNVPANDETTSSHVYVTLNNLNCNDVYQLQVMSTGINNVRSTATNKRAFRITSTLGIPCAEVPPAELALEKIGLYADNNSNPLPTLQDYVAAGIVGVTADNLTAVNAVVAQVYQQSIDTVDKLNLLVLAIISNGCLTREELMAKIKNGGIIDYSSVDISCITDMSYLFYNSVVVPDITGWDTSNVTDMSYMFFQALEFNQDISGWDTSKVTNMSHMFEGASLERGDYSGPGFVNGFMQFNQPIGSWDVSKVTDMSGMFSSHSYFSQDLSSWDVSSVTNMSEMFQGASAFDGNVSTWDTSSVTNMARMFKALPLSASNYNSFYDPNDGRSRKYHVFLNMAFNQPIEGWDVSKVTDMTEMFAGTTAFNQPLNQWDVSAVTNMEGMFYRATVFNQPLDLWNVSAVTNMKELFRGAELFNQDIAQWNVSVVTNMEGMFRGHTSGIHSTDMSFNQDLSAWDVSSVTNMDYMFYASTNTDFIPFNNQDLSGWNVSNVVTHNNFFIYYYDDRTTGNIEPVWLVL